MISGESEKESSSGYHHLIKDVLKVDFLYFYPIHQISKQYLFFFPEWEFPGKDYLGQNLLLKMNKFVNMLSTYQLRTSETENPEWKQRNTNW